MLFVCLVYLAACGLVFTQQRRIIFKPTRVLTETPQTLGLNYTDVWLPVSEDHQIHGWWIPAANPRGTLLYFHGNGYNIAANLGLARRYHALGLSVLMIDYRGYGRSDGDFPQETWAYEDAEVSLGYLTEILKIRPQDIVVFGHSLGGAIAVNLAQDHPDLAGLIVQSSFSSMTSLAKLQGWPNLFPLGLLLNQRFDSLAKVPDLAMPKLWIHGTQDGLIPPTMAQQLHQSAPRPSQLQLFEGAGHNNVADVGGDRYDALIRNFLDQVLPPHNALAVPAGATHGQASE